jgi:hypothetical protein
VCSAHITSVSIANEHSCSGVLLHLITGNAYSSLPACSSRHHSSLYSTSTVGAATSTQARFVLHCAMLWLAIVLHTELKLSSVLARYESIAVPGTAVALYKCRQRYTKRNSTHTAGNTASSQAQQRQAFRC